MASKKASTKVLLEKDFLKVKQDVVTMINVISASESPIEEKEGLVASLLFLERLLDLEHAKHSYKKIDSRRVARNGAALQKV
jgi:hypothetical protein